MDSITLQCPITIKARITEKFKTNMSTNFQHQVEKITADLAHIDKDMKKVLAEQSSGDVQQISMMLQNMEAEKQKGLAMKQDFETRLEQLQDMEIGSELIVGSETRLVEIKVGDMMPEIMNTELLIEDGKIIEIRE